MPKISVIVPVYKAEKYLRKCVESILFGEEQDLEVILVEDCSDDGSWQLCQQLAKEYDQVQCLRNAHNSGVSHTRNRGLDAATGRYVLFVDSDDWVSGSYAKTMIATQEANPEKLVVCGYTFVDDVCQSRSVRDLPDVSVIKREDFLDLVGAVMIQQLWNKVFSLELIRKAGIRFDEQISMGEDYRFVLDVLEAAGYQECVIVHSPLYYYVRRGNASLMSTWASEENYTTTLKCHERINRICGIPSLDDHRIAMFREQYLYSIATDGCLSGRERREATRKIINGPRKASLVFKQSKWRLISQLSRFQSTLRSCAQKRQEEKRCRKTGRLLRTIRRGLHNRNLTLISGNPIGGVFSRDMNLSFQSPTVDLWIPAEDFVRFVTGLEHYLQMELQIRWGGEYPVGQLDDVELHFVRYDTCLQAKDAWERRKNRVDFSKVLVLAADRDGFDAAVFEKWKEIRYPKLLFTARREFAADPDSLFFPEYEKLGCVPELIPGREFYKEGLLLRKVNQVGVSQL